ncbi:MAG: helix-turn-helix domain-containing protein, partial [Dongiaceae bacterium]
MKLAAEQCLSYAARLKGAPGGTVGHVARAPGRTTIGDDRNNDLHKQAAGDAASAADETDAALARVKPELPQRARELMIAALGLFARRDFSAVTIKDIAKAAGVNTALIY